jgi:hypothetical protein
VRSYVSGASSPEPLKFLKPGPDNDRKGTLRQGISQTRLGVGKLLRLNQIEFLDTTGSTISPIDSRLSSGTAKGKPDQDGGLVPRDPARCDPAIGSPVRKADCR